MQPLTRIYFVHRLSADLRMNQSAGQLPPGCTADSRGAAI